ncbi:hypothetical protein BAZ12_11305 [Elizabethkingia miricola]|uniref:Uncharacterized protein n=1 Tax=Elizabethkingia miricola TaxID=172045 RepID=A0ABD4DQ88_ELIMR|nr:hypothetical protein ATB95_06440 [Elizabethkingia miricola]OPC70363.1 hypothetical protein BAZ12_11305 [Elizabethkingia miricola]OPC74292.1 hypothetical protein BAZ13_04575 [Elizabethkingia miricola]
MLKKLVSKTAIPLNVINKNRTKNRFYYFIRVFITGIIKTHIPNISISRAKDNFILLTNIKILHRNIKTPFKILSKFLKYNFE